MRHTKQTLILTLFVAGAMLIACTSHKKEKDDDNDQPTVSFTVTGAVSDNVSYSNTTSQTLLGMQGDGVLALTGMGQGYSLKLAVTADDVEKGNYNATYGQYINNSNGTKTFGVLSSGGINISSVKEIGLGAGKAYRIDGGFTATISDAGGGGSVQIQGTFSNVSVLQ